jgi:hypothetical protein
VLTRRAVIEPASGTVQRGPAGGRPAALYRFGSRSLVVTNPFAGFRPPAAARGGLAEPAAGEPAAGDPAELAAADGLPASRAPAAGPAT